MDIVQIAAWMVAIVFGFVILAWVIKNWDVVLGGLLIFLTLGSIPFALWLAYMKISSMKY